MAFRTAKLAVFSKSTNKLYLMSKLASNDIQKRFIFKSLYEDAFISEANSGTVAHPQLIKGDIFSNPRLEYGSKRFYRGKLKAAIFDWGGTVVDCGVCAPIYTFIELFKAEGVEITEDEARAPMGYPRKVHIAKILEKEAVQKRWRAAKQGMDPTEEDVERMFAKFVPQVLSSLTKYSNVIEGVAETVSQIRKAPFNLKIGSTTGFKPDASVCLGEVPEAKPSPFMIWLCAIRLALSPIEAIVKVDDTASGILDGSYAGCWTVGVAKTSSYVGLTESQLEEIDSVELASRLSYAYNALINAGAHYVIDTMDELPGVINDINRRLSNGERP